MDKTKTPEELMKMAEEQEDISLRILLKILALCRKDKIFKAEHNLLMTLDKFASDNLLDY